MDGVGDMVVSCGWVEGRGARGSCTRSRAPVPPVGVGTTATVPPCSSVTQRAMASPSPVPPPATPPEPKRSNTRVACPAGMPGPSSLTSSTQTRSSRARASTRTSPWGGLWRMALSTRFANSWAIRAGSATTVRSAGRTVWRTRTGRPSTAVSSTARWSRSSTRTSASRNGAAPASIRDRSSRSATSSLSRSAWCRALRRASSSGRTMPSTRFSSRARCAVRGVRSSCETVATSSRRCRSADARSAAIELKAPASTPTSSEDVAVTRCP